MFFDAFFFVAIQLVSRSTKLYILIEDESKEIHAAGPLGCLVKYPKSFSNVAVAICLLDYHKRFKEDALFDNNQRRQCRVGFPI